MFYNGHSAREVIRMEKKRVIEVGEVTITGNILCPLCGRWTGQNAQIDIPPYHCPYCELDIELLPNQERYYKEVYGMEEE